MMPNSLESLKERVRAVLDEMEQEGPYEYLSTRDYKGVPGLRTFCPVATCLKDQIDFPSGNPKVYQEYVLYTDLAGRYDTCPLPARIGKFITNFDKGMYKSLRQDMIMLET